MLKSTAFTQVLLNIFDIVRIFDIVYFSYSFIFPQLFFLQRHCKMELACTVSCTIGFFCRTRLERGNSEEYRRREQQASKIAAEIERCDSYKKHIALENGDGDDEEAAFSAVVRPGESSSQSQQTGSGGPGKYVNTSLLTFLFVKLTGIYLNITTRDVGT